MRPTYERQSDRVNEERAIALLERRGYLVYQFGRFAPCDFFAFNNDKGFLVEFKKRSNNHDKYPTVMMPEKKLRRVLDIGEQLKLGFLYVVEFEDGVYAANVKDYHTKIGGRKDRQDPKDIERMAHINLNDFIRIDHD